MDNTAFACGSKSLRYYVAEAYANAGIPVMFKMFFIVVATTDQHKIEKNILAVRTLQMHSTQMFVIIALHRIPSYLELCRLAPPPSAKL